MWQPPTPEDQELWNAVVAGVRAADEADRVVFEEAISRLTRLPRRWVHRVLRDAAGLLADELDRSREDLRPLLAGRADKVGSWLPDVDPALLVELLSGRPDSPVPADAQGTRHRLLLLARLARVAQVDVGAFVDVALAADARRAGRPLSALVPHCRTGR